MDRPTENKIVRTGVILVVIFSVTAGVLLTLQIKNHRMISSFEDCKNAGNPIMESFPEQCSANGRTFMNINTERRIAD
jgi:hypothetical protein